nr:hypothetical protein [Staphylococcus haemolyticus]
MLFRSLQQYSYLYKGKNIAEVLEMTVEEATYFFENIPKKIGRASCRERV